MTDWRNEMTLFAVMVITAFCIWTGAHYNALWAQQMAHDFQVALIAFITREAAANVAPPSFPKP